MWISPDAGAYKANVDAAFDGINLVATLVVVVRDSNGGVVFCASSNYNHWYLLCMERFWSCSLVWSMLSSSI